MNGMLVDIAVSGDIDPFTLKQVFRGGAVGEGSGTGVHRHGALRFSHKAGSTESPRAGYQRRRCPCVPSTPSSWVRTL